MSPVHTLGELNETTKRTCARDGCDTEFTPRRADHRCCSEACRTARWKKRRGYVDPRRAQRPREASRNAPQTVRKARPARIRPTLTLDEARALARATYRGDDPAATATQKIRDALERQARHG